MPWKVPLIITDLKRNLLGRTEKSEFTSPPMNALVTALPGLVPIFVLAGGVNALAGVLFEYNWNNKQDMGILHLLVMNILTSY